MSGFEAEDQLEAFDSDNGELQIVIDRVML
jgi:hypothetical protein